MKAGVIGVGSYLPDKIITNNDLEKKVNTSDKWITERTGISCRREAYDGVCSILERRRQNLLLKMPTLNQKI